MKNAATVEQGVLSNSNRPVTVWRFRSIDGKQEVVKMPPSHPDDRKYGHEYQTILFRGLEREYEVKR